MNPVSSHKNQNNVPPKEITKKLGINYNVAEKNLINA